MRRNTSRNDYRALTEFLRAVFRRAASDTAERCGHGSAYILATLFSLWGIFYVYVIKGADVAVDEIGMTAAQVLLAIPTAIGCVFLAMLILAPGRVHQQQRENIDGLLEKLRENSKPPISDNQRWILRLCVPPKLEHEHKLFSGSELNNMVVVDNKGGVISIDTVEDQLKFMEKKGVVEIVSDTSWRDGFRFHLTRVGTEIVKGLGVGSDAIETLNAFAERGRALKSGIPGEGTAKSEISGWYKSVKTYLSIVHGKSCEETDPAFDATMIDRVVQRLSEVVDSASQASSSLRNYALDTG